MPWYSAIGPSSSSIRISWLYFAIRSVRLIEPVLIWPAFRPTAISAMVVFCFTGTVGNDAGIASLLRHFDSVEGFCQRTDLVDLDQDRVGDALFNAFLQDCRVRNEQIVADQLNLASQLVCQFLPAVPVSFA